MTTTSELLIQMFREPTAHHLCDSGGIYGRAYQRNAERDLAKEPQATLRISEWGAEFSVSTFQHLLACLELDDLCNQFNALPCETWDSEKFYGIDAEQEAWLEDRGFVEYGDCWNSYNWENSFDQVLQGCRLERDGEEYVLLQVHGGCDVRSGYTDAKLFKIQDWMNDYFMMDDSSFAIPRVEAEAAGYPDQPTTYGDSDWVSVDIWGWSGNFEIYDHRVSDNVDVPDDFLDKLPHQKIEGFQRAIQH